MLCANFYRISIRSYEMLEENPFLECLKIIDSSGRDMALISALQLNAVLISALQLNAMVMALGSRIKCFVNIHFSVDEANQLVSILTKTTGRSVSSRRRYLIIEGSSISKGVDVLSAVRDEIDFVFLHLLENSGLWDRRAPDITTTGRWRPGSNLDESSTL
jgi:hypothetical protein